MEDAYPLRLLKRMEPYHVSWDKLSSSPFEAAIELKNKGMNQDEAFDVCYMMWLVGRWKSYPQIYDVDFNLAITLAEQAHHIEDSYALPSELLLHLPYPTVCFKAMPIRYRISNAEELNYSGWILASIEETKQGKNLVACFERDKRSEASYDPVFLLPIIDGGTIKDSLEALKAQVLSSGMAPEEHILNEEMRFALFAAQLILYIQSASADVRQIPQGTKRKLSSVSRKPIRKINVGHTIGRTLRSANKGYSYTTFAKQGGTHKRPHIRRGHFHSYWVGSAKTGDKRLTVKWIAPIYVGGGSEEPVVTKVK